MCAGVVEYALQLHRDTYHLIQAISVGPAKYTLSQLLQPDGQQVRGQEGEGTKRRGWEDGVGVGVLRAAASR